MRALATGLLTFLIFYSEFNAARAGLELCSNAA